MRRTALGVVVAVGLAAGLTACGQSNSGSTGGSGSGSTLTIGASISETGAYAGDGKYAKEGYEYAVDQINKQGGILGKKVQLKIYDDKSDPGTAVRLYTKLISQDHADILLGPYSSAISQAVVPLVDKFQKPTVFSEASAPSIFNGSKYAVQGQVTSQKYFADLASIAKQNGYKTIATISQNNVATDLICQGAIAALKKVGVQQVYHKDYPKTATDFSSLVLGMKQANPDMVLGCAFLPDSEGIAKEMNQQGLKPKLFAESIGPVEPDFEKSLGKVANGVITSSAWWPTIDTPGNKEFLAGYKQKFGHDPDYHAADAYAGALVMADAIKKAGSLDANKVNQALHTDHFQTVLGEYYVNSTGVQQGISAYLLQWQNGALKLIAPPSQAEAKVQLPYSG